MPSFASNKPLTSSSELSRLRYYVVEGFLYPWGAGAIESGKEHLDQFSLKKSVVNMAFPS
jgi:hypothetical protein